MGSRLGAQFFLETAEASTSGNQAPDNNVLLKAPEPIALTFNGSLGQHPGRFLEAGRRDEAICIKGGLGDAQQHWRELRRGAAGDCHGRINLLHLTQLNQLPRQQGGITSILNSHLAGHLADDDLNVLVINGNPLGFVNVLHLGHHAELEMGYRLLGRLHGGFAASQILKVTLEQLVGIDRTICKHFAGPNLLAIADHHCASQQNRILGDRVIALNHRDGD